MNDDSIAKHMYCHVLSVLLTGQKKKKKKKETQLFKHNVSVRQDILEMLVYGFTLEIIIWLFFFTSTNCSFNSILL